MYIALAVLAVLLALTTAVILWFRFAKGLWLPALIGFDRLPRYQKADYYTESGALRHPTGDETMAWYMGHPLFHGQVHLLFSAEDKFLALYCRQTYRQFCIAQGRQKVMEGNIEAFNYLLDCLQSGTARLVLDIYAPDKVSADRYKAKTSGIFYRGKPGKPLAIVVPGGGFVACMSDSEGYPYAMALHKAGYSAFVLTYRVAAQLGTSDQAARGVEATADLAQTVRFFCENSAEYGITLDNYAIFGSSAGGLMATAFAFEKYPHSCHEYALPRPSVIFPIYGLHWDVTATECDRGLAVFSVVGREDRYGFGNVEKQLPALRKMLGEENVDVTVYDNLAHGCCIGTGTVAEGWIERAIVFWERIITRHGKGESVQ